jgi:hypothetical protein
MVVVIVVAVACFSVGILAVTRWLPELAEGPVGTMAYFVVCGLSAAAVGLVGISIEQIVRGVETSSGRFKEFVVAGGLTSILRDAGTVAGLALIGYLLAPKSHRDRRFDIDTGPE